MKNLAIASDMSRVLVIDDEAAKDALAAGMVECILAKENKLTDFCNRMLDEIWPLLRADIYQDYLNRHVATPIVAMDRLVHPTPWDWDIQPCESCGKMVGTPVMKSKNAWLGNKYCYGCEQRLLQH